MGQIFISYARDDDEPFVKQLYQDLIENGIDVWWDRKTMESRGRTFLQELRDAIEASDRLIAVIGPTAVTSDYVKAEWEHALLFAKGVVPILRCGDYDLVPSDFSKVHCPDFRKERSYNEALEELLEILAKPVPKLGPFLTAIPSLPPQFLPRLDEITRLGENVLADIQRPTVITSARQTTALQGMGGVGKSVLAAAFSRATDTRRAFDDGVIWLTIGQRSDQLMNMKLLGLAFDDDSGNYVDIEIARAHLPKVLADKVCLIVLDDVWNVVDVTPFRNALGPRCRLLITTREGGLITALGAQEHRLGVLTDEAARRFLGNWCGVEVASLPSEAVSVAKECGNLPFALALCGAMATEGIPWHDMLEALQEADLTFIDKKFPNYPYPDVLKSLKVSLELLARENSEAAKYYHELVVFPVDETIPEVAVMRLWLFTNGLKERNARKLLTLLEGKALLRLEGEAPNRLVSLHDLQHDYLRAVMRDLSSLHGLLLKAYKQECKDGWPNGPNDGYYFEHLAYHLIEAGQKEDLSKLLLDFNWIQAKLEATDVTSLISDYNYFTEDVDLHLIQGAIRMSAHVLARDKEQLTCQLLGRLQSFQEPYIQSILEQACAIKSGTWLRLLTASLSPPDSPLIRTMEGSYWIWSVAVTPDGRRAISGSEDNTIKVWDLETGKNINTMEGHNDGIVTSVAVTPDGRRAISGSSDNTIKVWDLETGENIRTMEGHSDSVWSVAVSPDGRRAISGSGDNISRSDDNTIKVWDLETGENIRTMEGHSDLVRSVAVSPDGRRAISGSDDGTIKVWDLETGQNITTMEGHNGRVTSVAVTPDGRRAISGSDDSTIKVWDLETGKNITTMEGHSNWVRSVVVTPDGRRAISGSDDSTIKVWDLETGKNITTMKGHSNWVWSVAVTPDGRRAISGSEDSTIKVWDLETGKNNSPMEGHNGRVTSVAVTPDGRRAISGSDDSTIKVWDLETSQNITTMKGHNDSVQSVAVTPDGRRAISGSYDETIKVWDLETGQNITTMEGHKGSVTSVAVTPDGRRAISGSYDETIKVWDLETGQNITTMEGHNSWVTAVAVTPDGRRAVSGSHDETIKVWDLETGQNITTMKGYSLWVNAVAVTPDGRRAISGSDDSTIKVWDLETGQNISTMEGHNSKVRSVAVTPDGQRAISGSFDETIKVWDLETGNVISFSGDGYILSCAVSPDGKTIVAGDALGRVHFLRLEGVE